MTESVASSGDAGSVVGPEPSAHLGRVARGSAANLAGAVVSAIASFALVVVLTHGVSKSQAGVFFSVTSLFLVLVAVGQLGTDLGLVYFLSRARALGRHLAIDTYLRAAVGPVLMTGLAMSVALFVLAPQIGRLTNAAHAASAASCLRVLALFIAPACLATVLLAATRGMGTMRANVAIEQVGRQLTQLALVAIAVALAGSDTAIVWTYALPYVASFAAVTWWWRRLRGRYFRGAGVVRPNDEPAHPHDDASRSLRTSFWRFTAPRTFASVAQLLLQRIDIVLVAALANAPEAALFTAATRFVVVGQMGSFAVTQAIQPSLAATLAERDHSSARHLFQTSSAWLIAITWPLYLTFCLHAHALLAVFGGGYHEGATVLVLVSLGLLVGSGVGDVDSVLVMSGRTALSMINTIIGLVVMIGVDVWLIPDHGAIGAGIGWGAAIAVKNLAGFVQVRRAHHLHAFGRATLLVAATSVVCFAAVQLVFVPLPGPAWASLALGLAVGGGLYVVALWVLRAPLELGQLRKIRRRPTGPQAAVQ